jgi:hypothetical protein
MYAAMHPVMITLPILLGDTTPHPAFTRALTCISKYSQELFINAMPNSVSFSATNASLSAYCRFTYDRSFFTKFNIGDTNMRDGIPDLDDMEQVHTVTGQLYVQVFPLRMKSAFPRSLSVVIAPTRDSQTQKP